MGGTNRGAGRSPLHRRLDVYKLEPEQSPLDTLPFISHTTNNISRDFCIGDSEFSFVCSFLFFHTLGDGVVWDWSTQHTKKNSNLLQFDSMGLIWPVVKAVKWSWSVVHQVWICPPTIHHFATQRIKLYPKWSWLVVHQVGQIPPHHQPLQPRASDYTHPAL